MFTDEQFFAAALQLDCEVAALKAAWQLSSNGRAFRPDGRCRISFEGQLFWKELLKAGIDPRNHLRGNEDILFPGWNAALDANLHSMDQYHQLNKARQIDEEAALRATCWGVFHIAGFNYELCGYHTVKDFVVSQHYEENQLLAFCRYLENTYLDVNLRNNDWRGFASGFNGPDYHKAHMAIKLRKAYHQLSDQVCRPVGELILS